MQSTQVRTPAQRILRIAHQGRARRRPRFRSHRAGRPARLQRPRRRLRHALDRTSPGAKRRRRRCDGGRRVDGLQSTWAIRRWRAPPRWHRASQLHLGRAAGHHQRRCDLPACARPGRPARDRARACASMCSAISARMAIRCRRIFGRVVGVTEQGVKSHRDSGSALRRHRDVREALGDSRQVAGTARRCRPLGLGP